MIPRLAAAIERASIDERLTERSLRVLLLAWRHLDWLEFRSFKREFVAQWMRQRAPRFDASSAGRFIAELVGVGYLEEGPRDGQLKTYRLRLPAVAGMADLPPAAPAPQAPERRAIRHGGISA